MKLTFVIALFLTVTTGSHSQNKMTGTYTIQGIQDMSASFHFKNDGHFVFEYFYGAVDRFATGTYFISGDTIKLKSDKEPGKDFTITLEEKRNSAFEIIVKDPNSLLTQNIRCLFMSDHKILFEEQTNNEGKLQTTRSGFDKVFLQHPYYADVATMIRDADNQHNYFIVTLNPTLQQVSFKGIDLFIKDDHLTCYPNYLLPFENIRFVKE